MESFTILIRFFFDFFCIMVFRFLFIVCAFPVWGGQGTPVPPSVCLLERVFSLSLLCWRWGGHMFYCGRRDGVGGWFVGVRVAPCYLPEQG